jgi:hypothetical protein
MKDYKPIIVTTPIDDISRQEWDEKVNGQYFDTDCDISAAISKVREICPNVQQMSLQHLCNQLNDEEFFPTNLDIGNSWFGVIYIEV